MNLLVLAAHPQQKKNNTDPQINVPGFPDSLKRQKGSCAGRLEAVAWASVSTSQAHRERNCSACYNCRILDIQGHCKNQI